MRGNCLLPWQPNRLNQRYHTALRLAEVIWQATSPEHTPGSLLANGFLFNLETVFEDFVVGALSEELQARYGGVAARRYSCHLDEEGRVQMKPDLVWHAGGRPVAVVDAKYKQEKPVADLYQVLAYCTRYACRGATSCTPGGMPTRSGTPYGMRILRSFVMRLTSCSRPRGCWRRSGTSLMSWWRASRRRQATSNRCSGRLPLPTPVSSHQRRRQAPHCTQTMLTSESSRYRAVLSAQ
ncbi:MAG: 5-methylcytosine restriction system specificity protein McrC [Pseudonocardiaceae bacterium]